jgi:hypothetical protein
LIIGVDLLFRFTPLMDAVKCFRDGHDPHPGGQKTRHRAGPTILTTKVMKSITHTYNFAFGILVWHQKASGLDAKFLRFLVIGDDRRK